MKNKKSVLMTLNHRSECSNEARGIAPNIEAFEIDKWYYEAQEERYSIYKKQLRAV